MLALDPIAIVKRHYKPLHPAYVVAVEIESERCESDEVTDCLVALAAAISLGLADYNIAAAERELQIAFTVWLDNVN